MIRLFTTYGNYGSRAKSRTRYLQDTLGEEKIRNYFLQFVEDAQKEMTPWPVEPVHPISKSADGTLSEATSDRKTGTPTETERPVHGFLSSAGRTACTSKNRLNCMP